MSIKNVFHEEMRAILEHKWLESERAGYDVGLTWAADDWTEKHAKAFREDWERKYGHYVVVSVACNAYIYGAGDDISTAVEAVKKFLTQEHVEGDLDIEFEQIQLIKPQDCEV